MRNHKRIPSPMQELLALLLPAATLVAVGVARDSAASGGFAHAAVSPATPALRVCADPNNLPFSDRAGQGFENKIARVIGAELGRPVEFTWWAQRRGFVRNTLNAGACDLVVGVSAGVDMLATTKPYYTSTYVFVSRRDHHVNVRSFDDDELRRLRIGVQLIGDDGANTPPAHVLAARGLIGNVIGFTVFGDYAEANPPARIVDAVADRRIDVAVVWGPLAGYFARGRDDLALVPVAPEAGPGALPMAFAIGMGVRKGDEALKNEVEAILVARRHEIGKILDSFGVPRSPAPGPGVGR